MKKITNPSDTVLIDPNEPLILPDGTALVGRIEWFLYALCCLDYQNLPTPMSRIEEFANALITGEIPNIQPQSRAEQFFLAILDGNVSDLPQPQSRSEVLLDKLARGEFDLSDVEPIQSRYELLLAYLIKNGGIGNIDYVLYEFSEKMKTMYNTIEKPLKSLELSGNTLVNCVLEDTENDDYTSFDKDYSGTSFTINGTSEGAIKSAILKGQTLVNVLNYSFRNNYSNVLVFNIRSLNNIKPLTSYLMYIIDETNKVVGFNISNNNSNTIIERTDGTKTKVTTNDFILNNQSLYIYPKNGIVFEDSDVNKIKIMLIEYQEGMENWDIPYFTGMQSVKMPVLTTTGKNLINKIMVGSVNSSNGTISLLPNANNAIISDFIEINSDKSYVFSGINKSASSFIAFYDRDKQYISRTTGKSYDEIKIGSNTTINIPSNTKYIVFTHYGDALTIEEKLSSLYQFEEGSTATPYEPYKTNILSCNEDVALRGIGDVQDTLDCLTGELTERIGEIVLDGSENWNINYQGNSDLITFSLNQFPTNIAEHSFNNCKNFLISDSLPIVTDYQNNKGILSHRIGGNHWVVITVNRSDLISEDVVGFKHFLSTNPVTIQYQLATESIKTVDLNVVDQNNTKIDKIHVFDEVTHVNASSDELTPMVNIGKSVSYPTIIKPNTKYTVDLKRNDKPLTVNLGGTEVTFASGETRKTITTPSTLTNDKLSWYGIGAKCNEIMLIEGEIERNIDYFTGMQSVVMQNQMPILSTVGKNLFNPTKMIIGDGNLYGYYKFEDNENINYTLSISDKDTSVDVSGIYLGMSKLGINASGGYDWVLNRGSIANTNKMSITTKFNYVSIYPNDITTLNKLTKRFNIQVEYGKVKTTYEPYKTSILSCNEDVTLRGIGNVKDELDCLTGKVTERISEVILDGSENWQLGVDSQNQGDTIYFATNKFDSVIGNKLMANSFIFNPTWSVDYECVGIEGSTLKLRVRVKKDKLTELTVSGFKQWLSKNPITIQYELNQKSIKTVDLNVVDQDGNTIPKVKSHNGTTHLEVTVPKQSLLPNISAEVATDNSKDMSSLTVKHQEISETQSAIQDNIQSQSDEIDTALMATTEIFESILE